METRDKITIEAIKSAMRSLLIRGLYPQKVIKEAVEYLFYQYEKADNMAFLEQAVLHIQAYLELGFTYESGETLFDNILKQLGLKREVRFPFMKYGVKEVKCNKSQIRGMLGRWNSKFQSMPINDVVEDIMEKVTSKEIGVHIYWSGYKSEQNSALDQYELTISQDMNLFYDVQNNKYYVIRE